VVGVIDTLLLLGVILEKLLGIVIDVEMYDYQACKSSNSGSRQKS